MRESLQRWLGPAARRADLALAGAFLAGVVFLVALGPLERRAELLHDNDFSGFWAGARALVTGANPYDAASWRETTLRLGTQPPDTLVYGYPPWVALALMPLALLPLETAAWIWMLASVALAALGLRALLRDRLPRRPALHAIGGLTLFASQPAFHALVLGQWSFLLLAGTCAALVLLRRAPARAGLAALALLAKPQLAPFAVAGLVHAAGRDPTARRALLVAASGAAAVLALSTLLLPGWWGAWSEAVAPARLARSASLASALTDVAGDAGRAVAFVAIAVAAVVAATRFRPGSDQALAVWLALTVAGATYAWSYDHLLLLVPLVLGAGALIPTHPRRAALLLGLGCAVLLLVSPLLYGLAVARHRESFSAVVPAGLWLATVIALWPVRRA